MKKHLLKIVLLVIIAVMTICSLSSCEIVNQVIDPIKDLICAHEYVVVESDYITCTDGGSITSRCEKCGKESVEIIPATGHDFDLEEYGYTGSDGHAHVCKVCSQIDGVVAHTSSGSATDTEHELCTECGYIITPSLNHEHEYTILASDSTYHWYECICGEEGALVAHSGGVAKCDAAAVCDVCKVSYGSPDYTNHTLSVTTNTAPTCASVGVKVTACSGCTYTLTETTPRLDHEWSVGEVSCTLGKMCTREGCGTIVPATGHSYELTSTTSASCTEDGIATYTCSSCSDSYTNVVEHSHGHSVSKWNIASEALIAGETCKYTLTYDGACDICSEVATKTEEAVRHEYRVTVSKEATCAEAGVKKYTCSVDGCSDSYTEDYTDLTAHVWGEGVTAKGVTTYNCACGEKRTVISSKTETNSSVDSETLKDVGEVELKDASIALDKETADALNGNVNISANTQKKEDVTDVTISPEMGEQIGDADIFEFTMSDENGAVESFAGKVTVKIPYVLGGDDDPDCIAVWWLTEDADGNPTLQYVEAKYSGGFVVFETEHFSYYTVTSMTPAERCAYRGHEDRTLIYGATCTEDGYETHICLRCGRTEVIKGENAKGHEFEEEYNEEATCTKHGKVGHKCNSCGKKTEEKKPAGGHEWKLDSSAAASCTAPGHTTNKCGKCGDLAQEIIPQLTHAYTVTTVEAGCTEYGYTLHTCSLCGDTKKEDYVAPKGHIYSEERVEPTCTEDGYIKKVCSCGDEKTEKIKRNGHTWNANNATCGEAQYCLVCEYVNKAATGKHKMKDGICTVCGEGCNHKYVETERIAPTCISEGRIVSSCSCGSKTIELIPKIDHVYNLDAPTCGENKICTLCNTVFASATGAHNMVEGTCSVCGSVCQHSYFISKVVAPACETEGYTVEKCALCGLEKRANVTPALGHTTGKVCDRCDKLLVVGDVGFYTNMVDSFLNLKLNVELNDLVIYREGSKIGEYVKVVLDELWLTEDEDGNIIGYGQGTIILTYNGEYQVGVMKASVYDDMLYIRLDVDGGQNTNEHNALVYPLSGTDTPVGAIGSVYKWYKREVYPILSAIIAANVPEADRIIGGFMNAICTETLLADGGYAYTLDVNKVLAFNDTLAEKSIKEVWEETLGGNYADLEASVLELLDKTVYDALGLLVDQGISREDILGAVFSFMEMMGAVGEIDRDEAIANALAHQDMNKTIADVVIMNTAFGGTAEELKTELSNMIKSLGDTSVYEIILPMVGYQATAANINTAKGEVAKVITEAFGYFSLSTALKADGRINYISLALMNNEYVNGEIKVYFGFKTDKEPENITADIEMYDEFMASLNRGEYTDSFYVIEGYRESDIYGKETCRFLAFSIEEMLEIIEENEIRVSWIIRQEVVGNTDAFILGGIDITIYCEWIRFDLDLRGEDGAFLQRYYRIAIDEEGNVTEELYFEDFVTDFDLTGYYNTETGVWGVEIPYELRSHNIVEIEDKRVEPTGCEGLGKTYYRCEKCGIEYSVDTFNGHNYQSDLVLVDPDEGCTGGVNATHTCLDCGNVVTETLHSHFRATLLEIDLSDYGCCGGYIKACQCACGSRGDFNKYDTKCEFYYDYRSYADEDGIYHNVNIYTCYKCGLTISEDNYNVKEGCYRNYYKTVTAKVGGVTIIDEVKFGNGRGEEHKYIAEFELHGTSCDDGYNVRYVCSECGDSYESSGSGHRTYPTDYIDIGASGGCAGGYVQVYSCPCGQYQSHESYLNCDMRYNNDSYYDDILGCTVYTEASYCVDCGCRMERRYYEVKDPDFCSYTKYTKMILSVGNIAASYDATETYERHDMCATATLHPGATSCDQGVTINYSCRNCSYGYTVDEYWHSEFEIARIDLGQYGSVCGGYVTIRGCACGEYADFDVGDNCFCDFDEIGDSEVWIDGAINDVWQYSSSGERYFEYDAYQYICAVTDPEQCGYVIRYATYWLKDGCYAERYRTYQFGYNRETGECQYEYTIKLGGERRQYHAYESQYSYNESTGVSTTLHTCPDCGSTYTYIWHNNYLDGSKNEHIAVNNLNTIYPLSYEAYNASGYNWWENYHCYTYADGSKSDYKCTHTTESIVAPFGYDAYKQTYVYAGSECGYYTNEYAYTYFNGYQFSLYSYTTHDNGYWHKYDYTYNPDMLCECTESYSDSYGESWQRTYESHHWGWTEKLPTCTQDGGYFNECEICHTKEGKHEIRPAYGHQWVQYGDFYVCNTCGLQNANGADGGVVLEDLSAMYGNGENYVVGYYAKDYTQFNYSVSLIIKGVDGELQEIFLYDIDILEHETLRAKVFSIAAVKAAATELGYSDGGYLVRFAFVPLGADGSFDYAITFEDFDPLTDIITGNALVSRFVDYGQVVEISIVPEKSGHFIITSTCEMGDPYVVLCFENGDHIAYDDDGAGNRNFRIKVYLSAGQRYTLGIGWHNNSNSGNIPVRVIFIEA